MIEISVKCVEKEVKGSKEVTKLECVGAIRGNGGDIRREMIGALQMFDEVAGGKILCDAFGEFLEEKMARKFGKKKGAQDEE